MAAPRDFPFPFQPYDIQVQFAQKLYDVLNSGGVGIFESPTGTGKSLSLICGSLQWLTDVRNRPKSPPRTEENLQTSKSTSRDQPSWVVEYRKKIAEEEANRKEEERRRLVEKLTQRLLKLRAEEEYARANPPSKRRRYWEPSASEIANKGTNKSKQQAEERSGLEGSSDVPANDEFLLDEYESDGDEAQSETSKCAAADTHDYSDSEEEDDGESARLLLQGRKVFYCSRTHSQLGQFISEVKKTVFGDSIRLVVLGSRKALCIHDEVRSLGSLAQVNDRCAELVQQTGGAACPYFAAAAHRRLADYVLAQVRDIEEVVSLGKQQRACPYYGTRRAVAGAELVVLPYSMLFHRPTRESLGLELRGNVVLVDEAHNLVDALSAMYSATVAWPHLAAALAQLSAYEERYRHRLHPKNLLYIRLLLFLCRELLAFLSAPPPATAATVLMSINDFLFACHIDNLNLFKLERFIKKSNIVNKLKGFTGSLPVVASSDEPDDDGAVFVEKHRPALGHVEAFLTALTNDDKDGRVLVSRTAPSPKAAAVQFVLLNPEAHFKEIVEQAKAVVLAGGTMHPVSDILDLLIPDGRAVHSFSCGHIVPPANVCALILASGPSGKTFDFTYQHRNDPAMIAELGQTLLNMANVVPDGMVCFFPSYGFMNQVTEAWQSSGLIGKLEAKKRVFIEPRGSSSVEKVLQAYQAAIDTAFSLTPAKDPTQPRPHTGAILFCVVGGKMSEGINFSDGLGRCVVVVGLPFANPNDPVLVEKLRFLQQQKEQHSNTPGKQSSLSPQEYYENACMKAVNQSIGRSIRHAKDYAAIVLIDQRYLRPTLQAKLSRWIASSIQPTNESSSSRFPNCFASLSRFFQSKRTDQMQLEINRSEKLSRTSR